VVFVRHGETWWNRERRLQGQIDTDLSDLGQEQARITGARLRELYPDGFDIVASSDLKRAMDTTIAIIGSDSPMVADARLREIHAGDFEGKTIREVATDEATKQAWQAFVSDRSFRAPNGESHDDHMARCAAALDDLVLKAAAIDKVSGGKRRLLFVAHGGVMHCVHKHMTKDYSGKSSPHAGNCSIGVVDATVDCDTIMDWSLRRWNDVAHLQAVQTASSTI